MVKLHMVSCMVDKLKVNIATNIEAAQAVVNAGWNVFDTDSDTWPEHATDKGLEWLTQDEQGFITMQTFEVVYWLDQHIKYYADPETFMRLPISDKDKENAKN